ncbi:MAG TPA: cellulase family glycosylhydrolase [Opitutaceae bacterium]
MIKPLCLRVLAGLLLAHAAAAGPKPIEFDFVAPDNPSAPNPYSRELWAEVTTPGGPKLTLPAYYADGGLYAVRARPDEIGSYSFGAVSETTLGVHRTDVIVSLVTPAVVQNTAKTRLPSILIDPKEPRKFVRTDGLPYMPVGANLAWAPDGASDTLAYYRTAFPAFAKANLNWMRIWMAHWDGLNLDWLPARMGPSPSPGALSEDVAQTWDKLLEAAEDNGVYVQLVLQHHGQYSTANDSNWAENPWNAGNPGGFLKSPEGFFTDANARILTLVKYRYIIARWGWSPAIVAWELFNEVHWTDSFRHGHEDDVARWHADVAKYIRLVDVYGHLITTSTENLRSPIYAKMDYFQPHLYAANMLAAPRAFEVPYASLDRPAFYGEEGDDHEPVSAEVKKAGLNILPPVWASIMGEGAYAAQPWNGWQILAQDRQDELGAVFRFMAINRVAMQADLKEFSDVVECRERVPLRIVAGQLWQRRAAPEIDYPVDGAETLAAADVPAILAGSAASRGDGLPGRASYRLRLPHATKLTVHVYSMAPAGGALEASVDGKGVASQHWAGGSADPDPAILQIPVPGGDHTVLLENPGPDWIGISAIDLGLDGPALGLIGRRNDRFIEAWVWNKPNLHAVQTYPAVSGTVDLDNVPAGSWKVTWWDTLKGAPSASKVVAHPGGMLKLETPPILRHAAVVLTRTQ